MQLETIPLSRIYDQDIRFRTTVIPSGELTQSVERMGVIQPLRLVLREERYVLLSGWKRFWAAQAADISLIPALIIEQKDDLKAFISALEENLSFRQLSIMEKAGALKRLKEWGVGKMELLRNWLPRLGIPGTSVWLDVYLNFASWENELQQNAEKASLSSASMMLLDEMPATVTGTLLPLLSVLSRNKQRELLEYLHELTLRDNQKASDVLESEEIQDILKSENLSLLQRAEGVRKVLYTSRFPLMASWKEEFENLSHKISFPSSIRIDHYANFEEGEMTLTVRFRSILEFNKSLSFLRNVSKNPDFLTLCTKFCDG